MSKVRQFARLTAVYRKAFSKQGEDCHYAIFDYSQSGTVVSHGIS